MSHLAKKSSTNSGYGGARSGSGRRAKDTKGVTLRLTPEQHKKLQFLGGSKWVIKRLDELDDKPVFLFYKSPISGWSFEIVPGYQLNLIEESETTGHLIVKKQTAFSEKNEAKAFIEANRKQLKSLADEWLMMIEQAESS